MSRARSSRRQRSKLNQRLALVLVLLVAVTLFVGYNKLFQAPEQKTPEDPVLDDSTDTTDLESEALRSHLERKPNFYTILVSGVDDHNGGSDTNILVAVDAENNYIYGVSIPRDTKSMPITPAALTCWRRRSQISWAFRWTTRFPWTCRALSPWWTPSAA